MYVAIEDLSHPDRNGRILLKNILESTFSTNMKDHSIRKTFTQPMGIM